MGHWGIVDVSFWNTEGAPFRLGPWWKLGHFTQSKRYELKKKKFLPLIHVLAQFSMGLPSCLHPNCRASSPLLLSGRAVLYHWSDGPTLGDPQCLDGEPSPSHRLLKQWFLPLSLPVLCSLFIPSFSGYSSWGKWLTPMPGFCLALRWTITLEVLVQHLHEPRERTGVFSSAER